MKKCRTCCAVSRVTSVLGQQADLWTASRLAEVGPAQVAMAGVERSQSPDASPPTPERRWPSKPRRETATSDICAETVPESHPGDLAGPPVSGAQRPDSPDGSNDSEAPGNAQEGPLANAAVAGATDGQVASSRGSEASLQLQALAHHLMDEVSQVRQCRRARCTWPCRSSRMLYDCG